MELLVPDGTEPIHSIINYHTKEDAVGKINSLYPNGLSWHGQNAFFDQYYYEQVDGRSYVLRQPMLELSYELVRLSHFSDLPSRFTSFYACESLADAQHFRTKHCEGQGVIHRVSCEQYFRFDMNLLHLGIGIPSTLVFAERYWRSEAGPNPFWEILMQGPVTILDQVD
jgi:hypothetical protein